MARNVMLVCVLLAGLLIAPGRAEEDEDGHEHDGEEAVWGPAVQALEVFETAEVYQGEARSCEACTFVVTRILNKWSRYAYKLKNWSHKKKLKKATRAVKKACKGIETQQIALANGKFEDFNVLMRSGSIGNLNMNGEFGGHLKTLCEEVVKIGVDELPEKMANVARLFDYNLQKDLCESILPACGKVEKTSETAAKKNSDVDEDLETIEL